MAGPFSWAGVDRQSSVLPSYAILQFRHGYISGPVSGREYVAVWDDLGALGPRVRQNRYHADAAAVAAETMCRARHNVELLVKRLDGIEYRFLTLEAYEESHRQADRRLEDILNRAALRSKICDGTWESAAAFRKSKEPLLAVQKAAEHSRRMAIEFIEKTMGSQPAPLEEPDGH